MMAKKVVCNIYGPVFGQYWGELEIDGVKDPENWYGRFPAEISKEVREEYVGADIQITIYPFK